jgi:hypothetical protein
MTCEHGANISLSTRVHTRVNPRCRMRLVCGAFVAAVTRPCPRFPRLSQDGKEGVDGSSPSEGLQKRRTEVSGSVAAVVAALAGT